MPIRADTVQRFLRGGGFNQDGWSPWLESMVTPRQGRTRLKVWYPPASTSSYRKCLRLPWPCRRCVVFAKIAGELVTIGSPARIVRDVRLLLSSIIASMQQTALLCASSRSQSSGCSRSLAQSSVSRSPLVLRSYSGLDIGSLTCRCQGSQLAYLSVSPSWRIL